MTNNLDLSKRRAPKIIGRIGNVCLTIARTLLLMGGAVVVLGIVLLMRFGGREMRT